jgi:hypothetical protein
MRSHFGRRSAGVFVILSAALAFPASGVANPAGAPATPLGPALSTGAKEDGGIGGTASAVAQVGLADDFVLFFMGVTPPGNPSDVPVPPPICGVGCSGAS